MLVLNQSDYINTSVTIFYFLVEKVFFKQLIFFINGRGHKILHRKMKKIGLSAKATTQERQKGLSDKPPQAFILPQAALHLRGERARPFTQGDGRATALLLRAEAQPLGEL